MAAQIIIISAPVSNTQGPLIAGLFYYLVASSTYVLLARATSTGVLVTNC